MQQFILPSQGINVDYLGALEIAIKREIKAKHAYQGIAQYTNSENLKRKLEFLAQEEQSHRDNIEDLYKKIGGKIKDFDNITEFPNPEKIKKEAQMEITDILKLAIEKENEARDFYVKMADSVDRHTYKELFRYLAEEELTHRRMLELELRLYKGERPIGIERSVEMVPGVYKDWW